MSDNNKDIDLTIHEGETLLEAVRRKAAEMGVTMPKPEPEPERIQPGSLGVAKKSRKSSKGSRSPQKISSPDTGQPVDNMVYATMHVYRREDESDGVVRSNATFERKMHGPNILVFQHLHPFGEECTPACREKVVVEKKEED